MGIQAGPLRTYIFRTHYPFFSDSHAEVWSPAFTRSSRPPDRLKAGLRTRGLRRLKCYAPSKAAAPLPHCCYVAVCQGLSSAKRGEVV